MSVTMSIVKRELRGYFATPVAYVFLIIFLLLTGVFTFSSDLGNFFGRNQADLVSFSLRGEGHVGFPDRSERRHPDDTTHVRLAVGVDKMFAWHNSTIGAEYAYYSDGAGRPEDYLERAEHLYPDDLSYLGRHYVGLIAGGEIIPILRAGAVVLVNPADLSGIASLSLVYNIADEADFLGGLLAGWGEGPKAAATLPLTLVLHSEYGATPVAAFLETRFYF
jgi:hypothetical protein